MTIQFINQKCLRCGKVFRTTDDRIEFCPDCELDMTMEAQLEYVRLHK